MRATIQIRAAAVALLWLGNVSVSAAQSPGIQIRLLASPPMVSSPADAQSRFEKPLGLVESSSGEVFVLESQFNEVSAFDAKWRALGKAGSARPGPGQVRYPNRLRLLNDGRVGVVDAMRGLVTFKREQQDLAPAGVVKLPYNATDACAFKRAIVAMTEDTGKTIHVLEPADGAVRSFVDAPRGPNRLVVGQLSQGKLLCAETQNLVIVAYQNLGEVRAFDENGSVKWKRILNGFDPFVVTPDKGGAMVTGGPDGSHRLATFAFVSDSVILLQGEKAAPYKSNAAPTILSILLDAKSGSVLGTQLNLPIATGISKSHFFTYSSSTGQISVQQYEVVGSAGQH